MEEQHVKLAGLAGYYYLFLAAKVCETSSEFQKESRELPFKFSFQFLFIISVRER